MSLATTPAAPRRTPGPAARAGALEARLEELRPAWLPPGTWFLVGPDRPGEVLEVEVGPAGEPLWIALTDAPRSLAGLTKAPLVILSWLLQEAVPGAVVPFTYSGLARVFGYAQRIGSVHIEYMREGIARLARPTIVREVVDLRGGEARWRQEPPASLVTVERVAALGDRRPGEGEKNNAVAPSEALALQVRHGAWRSVAPARLLEASTDARRRLALYATLATLRPGGPDGIVRVPLAAEPLYEVLGITDPRRPRARRQLAEAVEDLAASDARFAGSDGGGEGPEVLLVRSLPLAAPPTIG